MKERKETETRRRKKVEKSLILNKNILIFIVFVLIKFSFLHSEFR